MSVCRARSSADAGTLAVMSTTARPRVDCSRLPVRQQQRHDRRPWHVECDGRQAQRSSQSEVAAVIQRQTRVADQLTNRRAILSMLSASRSRSGQRPWSSRPRSRPQILASASDHGACRQFSLSLLHTLCLSTDPCVQGVTVTHF